MTRRVTVRQVVAAVVAVLFIVVNVGGAGYAAVQGELAHAGLHVGLLLLGAYPIWRLAQWRLGRRLWPWGGAVVPTAAPEFTDRLTHLEQSVDAVAIEVERIGEGQRFVTRFLTETGPTQLAGDGAAKPIVAQGAASLERRP